MRNKTFRQVMFNALAGIPWLMGTGALAAESTAEQALELQPVQSDVEYDIPAAEAVKKCQIEPERALGSGWAVRDENGRLLRRFLDTNGDNKLDQWSYFLDGIESYRDIDANFNGNADQYRWLGTTGIRWGLDTDEDGKIDSWKMISPEEVTAEVVAALREKDAKRFERLLLTTAELDQLGVGQSLTKDLGERLSNTRTGLPALLNEQKLVTSESKWLHFGASKPGVIPASGDGAKKDLIAYDNVAAIVEAAGKHSQVSVGTLLQVGTSWRIVDLPKAESSAGFFYTSLENVEASDAVDSGTSAAGVNEAMQTAIGDLEKVDKQLAAANDPAELAKLNKNRADILERVAQQAVTEEDRESWTRQFVDSISASVQSGDYPEGIGRLKGTLDKLTTVKAQPSLLAHVKFHYLTANYSRQIQQPNADFVKIQEQWVKDLEALVKEYPTSDTAPEAMLQLAIAHEFAGNESDAGRWYGKLATDFPTSGVAKKAAGAKYRLESVGKSITLSGKTAEGQRVDLASLRGRAVLIHYWATWCEPC